MALKGAVGLMDLACGGNQPFNNGLNLVPIVAARKFLVRTLKAFAVARRCAKSIGYQFYNVGDLGNDTGADVFEAVVGMPVRKVGIVNQIKKDVGQSALAGRRLVEHPVESRVLPRRVSVRRRTGKELLDNGSMVSRSPINDPFDREDLHRLGVHPSTEPVKAAHVMRMRRVGMPMIQISVIGYTVDELSLFAQAMALQ
jgi:hypothetical protein